MSSPHPELLAGLDPDAAADVLALGRTFTLAAGETLFDLGQPADSVYVVRSGRMALTLPIQLAGGARHVFIEERSPGQTLGWSALIPPCRFTLKASAPVDTELLVLPKALLLDYFTREPQVGFVVALNIAQVIGHRLQVVQTMWLREVQHLVNAHA